MAETSANRRSGDEWCKASHELHQAPHVPQSGRGSGLGLAVHCFLLWAERSLK